MAKSPRATYAPKMGVWQEYLRELTTANEKVRLLEAEPTEAYAYVQQRMEGSWRRHRESVARQAAETKRADTETAETKPTKEKTKTTP